MAKVFQRWYEQVMFVCEWVLLKYYIDTTQVLQTKLTKWGIFTHQFRTNNLLVEHN